MLLVHFNSEREDVNANAKTGTSLMDGMIVAKSWRGLSGQRTI